MHTLPSVTLNQSRTVEQRIVGRPTSDGAGVTLTRVIDHRLARRLDPFLMLDAFGSSNPNDYLAGFPNHPHRGFETVTFMLAGRMRHRDSAGNEGLLQGGGVQWMTAGRGVIHSEMPEQQDGVMEGFQLWLNLPARDKMRTPWYRDVQAADLPRFSVDSGAEVTVIAGSSHGVTGAVVREGTEPIYLDVAIAAGGVFRQAIPEGHTAFFYVYRGAVKVGNTAVSAGTMGLLANDAGADGVEIRAEESARLILLSGKPLREPIVQYGPFVMNTEAEIRQAISDFQAGRLA